MEDGRFFYNACLPDGSAVTVNDEDLPPLLKYMRRMVKKNHRFER